MESIAERISAIRTNIPNGVKLVCVSKFQPKEAIEEAYQAGERDFGESRVQELKQKVASLPDDIRWHFIGHLQTNKVRDLIRLHPYLIHSVDSLRLLHTIEEEASKERIVQDILLEVHVATESTKTGFSPKDLAAVIKEEGMRLSHVRICGVMAMATNTDDEAEIRRCFENTATIARQIITDLPAGSTTKPEISMGMSEDYPLAIECGSTMVRIGSSIFGERRKKKAFFFDMDGVLFDSMPTHAEAWGEVMRAHGWPFTALDVYINEGRTGKSVIHETVVKYAHREPTDEETQEIYNQKKAAFARLGGAKPMKDVDKVLKLLHERGDAIWVVTGSGQKSLLDQLNTSFPGIFTRERMVTAFDVTHGKPDPEPYLKAWEGTGLKKEQCYVVENAPLGVRAGKGAGLYTIAVNTGILPDEMLREEGADQIFHNMEELYNWLLTN